MNFDKIVNAILDKEPVLFASDNVDEIEAEKKLVERKLDELYVDGYIDESFHQSATKIVVDEYNSKIQGLNKEKEDSDLRFGMAYVRELTGKYPSIYNGVSGTLGESEDDARLKINYKSLNDLEAERDESISLLYEQYTSGKISSDELQNREEKINYVYDSLMQSLPNKSSRSK